LTKAAVANLQKKNGLTADGLAGAKTMSLLYSGNVKKNSTSKPSSSGSSSSSNSGSSGSTGSTSSGGTSSAGSVSVGSGGATVSGSAGNLISIAASKIGSPYVWGAKGPSSFDCSGFTSYVYKHFGYSITRTSSSQRSDGVGVSKSKLQAGDIVCFSGHVGIYIGDGDFIHAANPKKGVIISSLSESYYKKNYITARRILD
jgi:cell wall-associated NlpC family hydrolase